MNWLSSNNEPCLPAPSSSKRPTLFPVAGKTAACGPAEQRVWEGMPQGAGSWTTAPKGLHPLFSNKGPELRRAVHQPATRNVIMMHCKCVLRKTRRTFRSRNHFQRELGVIRGEYRKDGGKHRPQPLLGERELFLHP